MGLVSGLWFLVSGLWSLVSGLWSLVSDLPHHGARAGLAPALVLVSASRDCRVHGDDTAGRPDRPSPTAVGTEPAGPRMEPLARGVLIRELLDDPDTIFDYDELMEMCRSDASDSVAGDALHFPTAPDYAGSALAESDSSAQQPA